MKSISDVVAEPVDDDTLENGNSEAMVAEIVRRASLDSVDRVSLASSTTTSSSILSGGSEIGNRTLKSLKRGLGKLWRRHRGNASITEYDPSYKVAYLGNVLTGWAKGEIRFFIFMSVCVWGFFSVKMGGFGEVDVTK